MKKALLRMTARRSGAVLLAWALHARTARRHGVAVRQGRDRRGRRQCLEALGAWVQLVYAAEQEREAEQRMLAAARRRLKTVKQRAVYQAWRNRARLGY